MIDMRKCAASELDPFAELSVQEKLKADLLANIAVIVHEKRLSDGLTQAEFAKRIGVSQAKVSKWENGNQNITIATLAEISDKLGIRLMLAEKEDFHNEYNIIAGNFLIGSSGQQKDAPVCDSSEVNNFIKSVI